MKSSTRQSSWWARPSTLSRSNTKSSSSNDGAEAGIAGEATPAPAAAKGHKIALVQFLKGHPVHRLMQLGFSDACTELKYDCELLLTDSTTAEHIIPLAEH